MKPGQMLGLSKRKQASFKKEEVAAAFRAFPPAMKAKLMTLRRLIFETASATEGVGELEEALRWGEPSYLTTESKSGSTIRMGWHKSRPHQYAMYFNCRTNLVASFRQMYPNELTYEGNRSITFDEKATVPTPELRHCISLALTYHLDKEKRPPRG